MPVDLNIYSSWAANNRNVEVAVKSGGTRLEAASAQVGALSRFFNCKSATQARQAVMTDFTRALSAKYGASLALHALSEAGLTPTSKLDGKTIASVIKRTHELHAKAIDDARRGDICLAGGTVTAEEIRGYKSGDKTFVRNYMMFRMHALDALGEMPLEGESLKDFAARVNEIKQRLQSVIDLFKGKAGGTTDASALFYGEAKALIAALDRKVNESTALLEGSPLSASGVHDFKAVWREATVKALEDLVAGVRDPSMQSAIRTVADYVRSGAADGLIPLTESIQKDLAKVVLDMIKAQSGQKGDLGFDDGTIARKLGAGYRKAINERPWPVVEKKFTAVVGGEPVALTSKITPGKHIGALANADVGPIGATYEQGVNGYMCHSAQTEHAVNLAASELTVEGSDGKEHLAFRGIRHGVHCAWEIPNPGARAAFNVKRAQEAVIAAFLANRDKIKVGDDTRTVEGEVMKVVKLPMVSVSLLTPDTARRKIHDSLGFYADSDEHQMLREQRDAWDAVSEDGVVFRQGGQAYIIKPEVLTFNFGVNAGAVKYSAVGPDFLGGWGMSDEMNMSAMKALEARANAFIQSPGNPPEDRIAAHTLLRQCREVLAAQGERTDGNDAYKVAARLAVLTHLIGATPCWNCKSGKDRTGEMDVECKFLSALVKRGEPIPEPGAKLTEAQRGLFRAIAFESGNFELQKMNTGFAGFKTSGVASIPERLGGREYREFHKGGSGFVKV